MTQNTPQIDAATAMMLAAEYVEQEGRYEFYITISPPSCDDKGCVLGWISFVLGKRGKLNSYASTYLGYSEPLDFYRDMTRVMGGSGEWHHSPTLAATGLRKLAQERMNGNP